MNFEKTSIGIKKTMMQGVCYSVYKGSNRLYGVLAEGGCATFLAIDLDMKKVIYKADAEGATGSWGVEEASDGRIYFGTYTNAGLYRFDPEKEEIETLTGNLPDAKFIFSLASDENGNIYGGTWPNCAVFRYNGEKEEFDIYDQQIVEDEDYVRMVTYDPDRKCLYASVSAHCSIIEYRPGEGAVGNILPEKYKNEAFAKLYGMWDGKLIVYMASSEKFLYIDPETKKVVKEIEAPNMDREILPPPGTKPGEIALSDRSNGIVIKPETDEVFYFKSVNDESVTGLWPYSDGKSLLISGFEGNIFLYDTQTGRQVKQNIKVPRKNIEIRQLHLHDGKIYASGYLRGGIFIYDPETDSGMQYDGVGQSEGITSSEDKVYFGKYPGAEVFEYDPKLPWEFSVNPRKLFELKHGYNQDRPFALEVYGDKLYVGTIPNYGDTRGALAEYNLKTGELKVVKDFSENRSIISLKAKDGVLYGGTTVCGGLGSRPAHDSGCVFAMDIGTGEYLYRTIPVKGCKNAGGLCFADDGTLLGCADGVFFVLDPATGERLFSREIVEFNHEKDYKWEVSFIKKGPGRLYYMVASNTLFSYDHDKKVFSQIEDKKVNLLEFDDSGRLYCQYEENVREVVRSSEAAR